MARPVHHVTLSVSDASASAAWYQSLFGEANVIEREGPGWRRVRLEWPSGLVIGLTEHFERDAGAAFSHLNPGLDHIGLSCESYEEVRGWAEKLDRLGFAHGPLEDAPYGYALTARDPDRIPIEFFCPK